MSESIEEIDALRAENMSLRRIGDQNGDALGDILDNQAWVMLSHIASRLDATGNLIEEWQDAWAEGKVQEGYFTANRGAAAWVAAGVNKLLLSERRKGWEMCREAAAKALLNGFALDVPEAAHERVIRTLPFPEDQKP